MYESGLALREVLPLSAQTSENGQESALSSVASSCPSVSVHPAQVTLTVNEVYDHLITGANAKNLRSSPVSPYEMVI